ncbi:MAG: hypothetical protein ACTSUO_06240 [Candidatus Thorarchaeota archaeon]
MTRLTIRKAWFLVASIGIIIGLLIFLDDLHDFVPGTEWLHWMPDFSPVYIGDFHFEHLYVGAIFVLIGLIVAILNYRYIPRGVPVKQLFR